MQVSPAANFLTSFLRHAVADAVPAGDQLHRRAPGAAQLQLALEVDQLVRDSVGRVLGAPSRCDGPCRRRDRQSHQTDAVDGEEVTALDEERHAVDLFFGQLRLQLRQEASRRAALSEELRRDQRVKVAGLATAPLGQGAVGASADRLRRRCAAEPVEEFLTLVPELHQPNRPDLAEACPVALAMIGVLLEVPAGVLHESGRPKQSIRGIPGKQAVVEIA